MQSKTQTKASPLFLTFKEIESGGSRSILRFVEEHATDIQYLDVSEYFGLQYAYCAALYVTANYNDVVAVSTELLELSIMHNFVYVEGEDAFRALLFWRASSYFHQMKYDESIHVLNQLLRLHPNFIEAGQLYEKALYQKPNPWISKGRAFSVALFLLAATLIAFEVLIVHHFADAQWRSFVEYFRNGCFLLGWILLLGGDISHRTWAWTKVKTEKRSNLKKRKSRI